MTDQSTPALLALLIVAVSISGCIDRPTRVDVSNYSEETVPVSITVSRNGDILKQYEVDAAPGTARVDEDSGLRGTYQFYAVTPSGEVTEELTVKRGTPLVHLLIDDNQLEWHILHADP